MGIYIPGMEMPTTRDTLVLVKTNGTAIAYEDEAYVTTAVPVPPHGDLIERNKANLTDFEIVMCNGDYKEGMKMLLEKIESAPTIIPAEAGET